jgi:hypothetical protein
MPPLTGLEKFVGSVYYKDVAPMALEFLNDWPATGALPNPRKGRNICRKIRKNTKAPSGAV